MAFSSYPAKGGIPSGNTASRPSGPVIGDTYYNGQLEILEIFNGTIWVAASAPPATPQLVSVTDVGTGLAYTTGGSLTTVFTPGSGGGTPSQYNAFTTAGGFSTSGSSTTVTLTGLTPATSFTVYGNAQNNFGTTVNTPNAAAVTVTTKPQAPTIGTATASTSANEVTVTWTNGANGGKNLSAITITPYLNGTTAETSRTAATTSSTSYTFTEGQLTYNSSYTFKVKATNANGDSPESSASNSVTAPNFVLTEYLVVAGGGAGGGSSPSNVVCGGGGAGGFRTGTAVLTKSTNYTVTIGAGGAGVYIARGSSGVDSVFSTITSAGGGGGGGTANYNGGAGGSGGGSAGWSSGTIAGGTGNTPSTSPSQGNNGGTGGGTYNNAAGGGGASAAGEDYKDASGAAGGNGSSSSITGTSVTFAGGGGGGGGIVSGKVGGAGGSGGGGAGGDAVNPSTGTAGTANRGGGGGGTGMLYPPGANTTGANGGSGVVILRWLTANSSITVGAGLTADSTGTDGSYSYKRITAGTGNVSFA